MQQESLCQFLSNSSYYDTPSNPLFESTGATPKKPVNIVRTYWRHVFSTKGAKTPTPKLGQGVTVALPRKKYVDDLRQTPMERKFRSALLEFALSNSGIREDQEQEEPLESVEDGTEDDLSFSSDIEGLELGAGDAAIASSSESLRDLRDLPVLEKDRWGRVEEEEEGVWAEEEEEDVIEFEDDDVLEEPSNQPQAKQTLRQSPQNSPRGSPRVERDLKKSPQSSPRESPQSSARESPRIESDLRKSPQNSPRESMNVQRGSKEVVQEEFDVSLPEKGSEVTPEELLVSDLVTSTSAVRTKMSTTRHSVTGSSDVYSKYDSLMQDIDDLLAQVAQDQESS